MHALTYQQVNDLLSTQITLQQTKETERDYFISHFNFGVGAAFVSGCATVVTNTILFKHSVKQIPPGFSSTGLVAFLLCAIENKSLNLSIKERDLAILSSSVGLVALSILSILKAGSYQEGFFKIGLYGVLPFAAGFVGFLGLPSLIKWVLSRNKTSEYLETLRNSFSSRIAGATITEPDIACLLQKLNEKSLKVELIGKMNFAQLSIVRNILNKSEFNQIVHINSSVSAKMWKKIIEISSQTDSKAMMKLFSEPTFVKLGETHPELFLTLDRELSTCLKPEDYEKVRPTLEAVVPQKENLSRVSFTFSDFPSLIINKGAIRRYCETSLLDLLFRCRNPEAQDFLRECSVVVSKEFIGNKNDYEVFCRYLKRINGEKLTSTFDELLSDLKFANKWNQVQVIGMIETEIERTFGDITNNQLYTYVKERFSCQIAINTESFIRLRDKAASLFLPILSEETWDKYIQVVSELGLNKENEVIQLILEKFPSHPLLWAERLCSVRKPEDLVRILAARLNLIDKKTVKIFWEKSKINLADESSQHLQRLCLEWARGKSLETFIQIWDIGMIPDEFLALLKLKRTP